MWKKIIIGLVVYIGILLIIFAVNAPFGEKIDTRVVNMFDYSTLDEETATCEKYHGEVISNIQKYAEFRSDCEITERFEYDQDYFNEKVIVLYYYNGSESYRPRSFHDYFWSTDNHEIIKLKHRFVFPGTAEKTSVFNYYYLEMEKDDVLSGDILFD